MKERPILFSGPMVRALLEGRKTQTRRIVKPQPTISGGIKTVCYERHPFSESALAGTPGSGHGVPDQMAWVGYDWVENPVGIEPLSWIKCPYGQPGDRLWVRESFWQRGWFEHDDELAGTGNWFWDSPIPENISYEPRFSSKWRKRPSIHMPRGASRILLEVVSVRVERLNDISHKDVIAEGIEPNQPGYYTCYNGAKYTDFQEYQELWESINGKGTWDENPWVWVIEFKVIQP